MVCSISNVTRRALPALVLVVMALTPLAGRAVADDYPIRTVKIVVPFPAGGSADAIPRLIAQYLSKKWGQSVIIENKAGAGGNIGAEAAYRSEPDGYTLLSTPPPPLAMNQSLYPSLSFEPAKFEPIIITTQIPTGLQVNPDKIKANTLPDLIAYLKQNPDKVTVATQGNGTTSHLTSEMFQMMAKVKMRSIPYRGSAPALQGLLAGDVDLMFDNLGVSLPLVKAGKLKLLAVASEKRLPSMPDVAAVSEILPGFESAAWYALVAPPNTPKAIVTKINADVNEILKMPEVQEKLSKFTADVYGGSPEKASKYIKEEIVRWKGVIKAADIKLQ
jgi:tripartite-type tricarboxylate transporter receptor subunit TctC